MPGRRRLGLLLPLLLLWPGTAGAQSPSSCVLEGDTVRAESAEALVLERPRGRGREWFACDRATGRRQFLGATSYSKIGSSTGFGPFAAGGTKVAFVEDYSDRYGSRRTLVVIDVREDVPPSAGLAGPEVTVFEPGVTGARRPPSLRALVVSPDGRLAYRTTRAVHVVEPDGSTRTVDVARPGRLRALAIAGDRVTWRHAGVERSTALTLPPDRCARSFASFSFATDQVVLEVRRTRARACARAGDRGFVRVGGPAQVAGSLLAQRRRGVVTVTDLVTGAPVGRAVEVGAARWLVAPDGTIVRLGRRVVAHHPDGRRVDLGPTPPAIRPRFVDPVLGRVILGSGGQTSEVPLAPSCGERLGERVLARGDGVAVVADETRVRGERYRRYALCETATGVRSTLLLGARYWDGGTGATAFTLAGRFVAWSETSSAKGVSDSRIVIRSIDALDDPDAERTFSIPVGADALAISPDGRRAAAALQTRLVVFDADAERTLDTAIAGTLNDLAFDGDRLAWRHGGQERRATVALPATCAPPPDIRSLVQQADAVAGARTTEDIDRSTPALCRFAGGGWTDLPGEGAARVAGPYAASATRREVVVRDLATLAPVGVPVPRAGDGAWALLANGGVVVRDAHGLALHRLDGRVVTWQPSDVPAGFRVDELARHLVWERYNALPQSTPLPSGE